MPWPYAFLDLTDEQKTQRREALDHYARLAQCSALFPLCLILVHFLGVWAGSRSRNANAGLDPPSSPRVKEAGRREGFERGWRVWERRVRWWCGGRVVLGGEVLGRRGEVLAAVVWAAWLLGLSVKGTGRDYLHLTKRLGIVGASQLPLHYLLALKSSYSPIQYLTGRTHESLNILHQLLGRIITLFLYAHAALYLNFYIQSSLLESKLQEAYIICGILGIWAFTTVGTTALAPVRRWSYRVFYITHVVLATALLPLLWFHVNHIRIYIYESAAVYAANVVLRSLSAKTVPATLRVLDNGTVVDIRIPLSHNKEPLKQYHPGKHAYLSLPGHAASRTFRSNPFSLASLPSEDNELRFLARVLDGNTARLAFSAATSSKQPLMIEGPYGLPTHLDKVLTYDRVLFVAGGIGGTFIAPLYRQLLEDLSPSPGSRRRGKVRFVWVARGMEDVAWAVPGQGREREGFVERLEVWVTGSGRRDGAHADVGGEGIEMEERKGLLGPSAGANAEEAAQMRLRSGRPDLGDVVQETFSHGAGERVAVMVCGPRALADRLREEVGEKVWQGREVWFWEEVFAL